LNRRLSKPEIIESFVRAGKVQLVFRDVFNHGERSERASEAAACAGDRGLFWEMHALLFEHQDEIWRTDAAGLVDLMLDFGSRIENLDQEVFQQCLIGRRTLDRLKNADDEQRSRGITAQPIFEIGEQRLFGLQSFERMSEVIEAASK
jgi:protein-disulfide isomerase